MSIDKYWNYNDPASSEKKFRELLTGLAPEKNEVEGLEIMTQIARSLGLQWKFKEAHAQLDSVEEKLENTNAAVQIRYQLERGRVFRSSGKAEESKPYFLKALELAENAGLEFYAVDAAHMLGIVEKGEQSHKWNLYAVKIAENAREERARNWLCALYNNIGWTWFDMGEYLKAHEVFVKSYHHYRTLNAEREQQIARWCIAKMDRMLGHLDLALEIQLSMKDEKDAKEDGYVYEELGEIYLLTGDNKEAKKYFSKAYELLSKDPWLQANEQARLERIKALAEDNSKKSRP